MVNKCISYKVTCFIYVALSLFSLVFHFVFLFFSLFSCLHVFIYYILFCVLVLLSYIFSFLRFFVCSYSTLLLPLSFFFISSFSIY